MKIQCCEWLSNIYRSKWYLVTYPARELLERDQSLNAPMRIDGDGEWPDWLVDKDQQTQEAVLVEEDELSKRRSLLVEAMGRLNEREQHILTERRLTENPQTLEELSQVYDVSRERIRQIEAKALRKLKHPSRSRKLRSFLDQ